MAPTTTSEAGIRPEDFAGGHFPQMTHPIRVARALAEFIDETEAAEIEAEDMRELVISRMAADAT